MDQAVEHLRGGLDQLVLLLGQPVRAGRVGVEDQVERVVVVGDLGPEAGEVEVVLDVVLVDLEGERVWTFFLGGGTLFSSFHERISGSGFFYFLISSLSILPSSLPSCFSPIIELTSQKNSFPFREQNQVIQETTSLFFCSFVFSSDLFLAESL